MLIELDTYEVNTILDALDYVLENEGGRDEWNTISKIEMQIKRNSHTCQTDNLFSAKSHS
ncbi:hypothetical protein UFOVP1244_105 [uncultured Caudovirales phage]|uniref:Uncharacterized protein n=1 Tax=uncultured Caudovirales phage TaxID=2100421 RepID=A0A6J5R614_9CAUD|nr:hypothetical protein UFOVP1244_105 [uncultured Caudovirales phage]